MQHIPEVGRQHPYAASVPPINNQQSFLRPPIAGEQNLPNSQMHSHLLSSPPTVDHSQIMNPSVPGIPGSQIPPRLPTGLHGHGQPPLGYQAHGTNVLNANLLQTGIAPQHNSAPPLSSQVGAVPTDPDLSHFAPPLSTTGQSIASPPGPGFPQARQKQYLPTMPPMPSQTIASPVGPGLMQPGQRQYGSTMPPLPGQTLTSPLGMNRTSPGIASTGYQQSAYQQQPGYHNQMVQLYISI